MDEHTPGPWKGHADGYVTMDDSAALLVAKVVGEADGTEISPAQFAADVSLIAAAPALLKALEEAFAAWFKTPSNIKKIEPEWVVSARAAIKDAKAALST